jgi:adenylate cyclase
MEKKRPANDAYRSELRLLLEELCCDLCRFEHLSRDRVTPESIQISREFYLGEPGAFADIRVAPPRQRPYFVEVKYGYPSDVLLRHLQRKYGHDSAALKHASKVVLVVDVQHRGNWHKLQDDVARNLRAGLELEIWDEKRLLALLKERFSVNIKAICEEELLDVRVGIDRAKGFHAFGGASLEEFDNDGLTSTLLWHFGFWRLRQLREKHHLAPRHVFPPGPYQGVTVLLADLCAFSSYVRDTRDDAIVRHCLTSFYSKARYEIINNGGMFYQFVGDEAIGLFGLPDQPAHSVQHAFQAARGLIHIGNSISNHWQRHIDRVQASGGLHVGMAIGDLQVVSLRPFSRTYMGAIGDPINVAARLMASAGPGEIVISNSLYNELDDEGQAEFQELQPVEAHNIGLIKAWKLTLLEKAK